MTQDQLIAVMITQLNNFNKETNDITESAIHGNILDSYDGLGGVSSAEIYKSFVRYSVKHSNLEDKDWPSNWLSLSVKQLADIIFK